MQCRIDLIVTYKKFVLFKFKFNLLSKETQLEKLVSVLSPAEKFKEVSPSFPMIFDYYFTSV